MCTSPLVRYRLKKEPVCAVRYINSEVFDVKNKGFRIIGKKKLEEQFNNHSEYLAFMNEFCDYIEIPCGKCEECRRTYARDWSIRCYHESLMYNRSCFITLTISDSANDMYMKKIERSYNGTSNCHCRYCVNGNRYYRYPINYSLNKSLILSWLKKLRDTLRRRYNINIRYFGVGEYGSNTDRPHYHILIFGYDFPSVMLKKRQYNTFNVQKSDKGVQMKVSEELTELWPYGYSYIEELNINACQYVAKYCMKKIKFIDSESLYDYYYGRVPEFLFMSKGNCQSNRCKYIDEIIKNYRGIKSLRDVSIKFCNNCSKTRGGLGFNWFWKNYIDIKKLGYVVVDSKKYPIPQYYKKLIALTDDKLYDKLRNENIYYVNSKVENDPDYNSADRCKSRREINKKKNSLYNSRDVV